MKLLFSRTFLCGLIVLLTFAACKKDDDDNPQPKPENPPVAEFEVASTENLNITLNNSSKEATSYSWDFGDGNSSTEENPSHTYADAGTFTIKLKATNSIGSDDATQQVTVTTPYKRDGFYLGSVATSSAGTSYFGGYYGDSPSNDIDLTAKTSFQRIQFRAQHKEYLYGYPTDNEAGLTKFAIDSKSEELVALKELPLFDRPGDVIILNDEVGYFSYFSNLEVSIFNPSTMEITGSIDMSGGVSFPENDANGYSTLIHNPALGKIYAVLFTNLGTTAQFYDAEAVYVEVIDLASNTREKTIVHTDAEYAIFRGNTNPVIDESGNTYLIAQGQYGLDGNIGATAPKGSRPQILKIGTDSEFDTDYAFNPIDALGFQTNFFQLFTSMVYGGNNKAYGVGTAAPESAQIVELLVKLGNGTITTQEYDILVSLVLFDESMKLMEVDLITKTVTEVSGMPLTAGFAYPYLYNYNGKVYAQMTANGGSFNGFYEVDPSTNTGQPLFNLSAGGFAIQYIDIEAGL